MSEGARRASSRAWRMASLGPSRSGLIMSLASDAMPKPLTSARILAPRALAENGAVARLGEWIAAGGRKHANGLPGLHRAVVDRRLRGAGNADVDETLVDV